MTDQLLTQLGDLIGGSFSLTQAAFQRIIRLPEGQFLALLIVLAAGLSLAVGQSIILFINRVKPIRFMVSLLLNAVLFVFGFLFLAFICVSWALQTAWLGSSPGSNIDLNRLWFYCQAGASLLFLIGGIIFLKKAHSARLRRQL